MVAVVSLFGCDTGPVEVDAATAQPGIVSPIQKLSPAPVLATANAPAESRCAETIDVFAEGRRAGQVCANEVEKAGLTLIDLGDNWKPWMFREDPSVGDKGKQPYLPIYKALASEKFGQGPKWQKIREDRYFELYGIPPTFSILRKRFNDDARHECHDAIDDDALIDLKAIVREEWPAKAYKRRQALRMTKWELNDALKRRKLTTYAELTKVNSYYKKVHARFLKLQSTIAAINAAQQHLACDGFKLTKRNKSIYTWNTANAVGSFQRQHMLMADEELGQETRDAFRTDIRELDFRATLRALRARVVDSTGLIEDGSARETFGKILGRHLDTGSFRVSTGHKPLKNGAPDLISKATDAAARALGWTSLNGVRAFFAKHTSKKDISKRIAVRLPKLPSYHGKHMELRAEIDRGDVWYEPPRVYYGGCFAYPAKYRPTVTLYAKNGDREVALVRWHTTIGGWNKERRGYWTGLKYKNSDVGKRMWRDMIVSPAWYPFKSTPDNELVRRSGRGKVELKYSVFGPSYRSAYGLVMMIHHQKVTVRGKTYWWDNGIRTHGSANFKSIIKGCSHGCHRLYNHQSMRLSSFLLRHRKHVRHGHMKERYGRIVRAKGKVLRLELNNRGYRYEMTPPVQVEVLEGRIRGHRKQPITGMMGIPRRRVSQ